MRHLEALEAVSVLSLFPDDVHGLVDDLGALRVVPLGPAVASAVLAEDHVVRAEKLAYRGRSDGVNDTGFEVNQDGAGDIATASGLIVVDVGSFQLQVGLSVVLAGGVDAVLVGDDFPELGSNLVAALACLNVYDFSHYFCVFN